MGREPRAAPRGVAGYLPGDGEGPPCPNLKKASIDSGDPSQASLGGS